MSLLVNGLPGPLPEWKLNLPDSFDIVEHNWASSLISSDTVEGLPIAGAFLIKNSQNDENAIVPYKWGKKGSLLRAIPKLILLGQIFNQEEFDAIKAAVEDDCVEAGAMVLSTGTQLGNGLIFPDSNESTSDTIETSYTKQLDPFHGDLDPYTDYISEITINVDQATYAPEKWIGREVLTIENYVTQAFPNSDFENPDLPGIFRWPRFTNYHPEEIPTVSSVSNITKYVKQDYNIILGWFEPNYEVVDIPFNVYHIDDQKDAHIEEIGQAFDENIYDRIEVKCLNHRVNFDVSFEREDNPLNDEGIIDDGTWNAAFTSLQQEVLDAESAALAEIYGSINGEYVELEFDGYTGVFEYSQDRVDLIIGWIQDFLGT